MKEHKVHKIMKYIAEADYLLDGLPITPIQHTEFRNAFDAILRVVEPGSWVEWPPRRAIVG